MNVCHFFTLPRKQSIKSYVKARKFWANHQPSRQTNAQACGGLVDEAIKITRKVRTINGCGCFRFRKIIYEDANACNLTVLLGKTLENSFIKFNFFHSIFFQKSNEFVSIDQFHT